LPLFKGTIYISGLIQYREHLIFNDIYSREWDTTIIEYLKKHKRVRVRIDTNRHKYDIIEFIQKLPYPLE